MADHFFEVYFFGLICFHARDVERNANDRVKTVALLIEDGDHTPEIYLNGNTPTTLTKDVSFPDFPPGEARVLTSFDTFVPHLVPLTRTNVKLAANARGIEVTWPEGEIGTVDNYPYRGEYVLDGRTIFRGTGCVARINLMQFKTSNDKTKVKVNGTDEEVDSEGFVLIANREQALLRRDPVPPGGRIRRPHFRNQHSKVLNQSADHLAELFENDNECTDEIRDIEPDNLPAVNAIIRRFATKNFRHFGQVRSIVRKFLIAAHPECSNSQWP